MIMSEGIFEAVEECAKTLGFCAGALGRQPNFSLFDWVEDRTQRDLIMRGYLAEYKEGIEVAIPV